MRLLHELAEAEEDRESYDDHGQNGDLGDDRADADIGVAEAVADADDYPRPDELPDDVHGDVPPERDLDDAGRDQRDLERSRSP